MKKSLTQDEIQALYFYTEIQNIPYKDVQNEIVDHIATILETTPLENTSDSFTKHLYRCLELLPKDFFKEFLKQKRKSLTKTWWRRYKEGFTLKLTASSLFLSYLLYMVIEKSNLIVTENIEFILFLLSQSSLIFFTQIMANKNIPKENHEINLALMSYTGATTMLSSITITTLLILIFLSYSIAFNDGIKIMLFMFLIATIFIIAIELPSKMKLDLNSNPYNFPTVK